MWNRESAAENTISESQVKDLRLAAAKMTGAKRRAFQAEMTEKYCQGKARLAESRFKWSRKAVKLGLEEKRTGITCCGAQSTKSGNKRWEEKQPKAAQSLIELAESHSQQEPSFKSTIAYTRLTAAEALRQLKQQGFKKEELPTLSTMGRILNRLGYRLRPVEKAKPQKNCQKPTVSLRTSAKKTKSPNSSEPSESASTAKPQ